MTILWIIIVLGAFGIGLFIGFRWGFSRGTDIWVLHMNYTREEKKKWLVYEEASNICRTFSSNRHFLYFKKAIKEFTKLTTIGTEVNLYRFKRVAEGSLLIKEWTNETKTSNNSKN